MMRCAALVLILAFSGCASTAQNLLPKVTVVTQAQPELVVQIGGATATAAAIAKALKNVYDAYENARKVIYGIRAEMLKPATLMEERP